jgi:hypothetical protein
MAASYKLLSDHWVSAGGGQVLQAGTIATVGRELPLGFKPTALCDPQNADGLAAFYAAGPQLPSLIRNSWVNGLVVSQPVTRWIPNPTPTVPFNGAGEYVLTGLGAGLPFVQMNFGGQYP